MIVLRLALHVSANLAGSLGRLIGGRQRPLVPETYENHPYYHAPEPKPETWVFYCR